MISIVLGYHDDSIVDEVILSFMSNIFPNSKTTLRKFDFTQYLAISTHEQLQEFATYKFFRYHCLIIHLVL